MAHTYTSLHVHCVCSTKARRPAITDDVKPHLWAYMGGIARQNGLRAICVGGASDHVHMLLSLPPTLAVSKAVQLIKGGSSKWVHQRFPEVRDFAWQEGFGAFSIGVSGVDRTVTYINQQEEHHRRLSFDEEFLKRHGISYDERYVFG